jgi:Arc/MetJ-type ribon-helix-helix transcriptional regulator
MTIAIANLPDDLQVFVETSIAKGEYPDVEHLMIGALYQLKEQHMSEDEERDVGDAWGGEIAKRLEEIKNGTVKTIPGDEVMARLRGKMGESQHA